jgi:hypothetical protein
MRYKGRERNLPWPYFWHHMYREPYLERCRGRGLKAGHAEHESTYILATNGDGFSLTVWLPPAPGLGPCMGPRDGPDAVAKKRALPSLPWVQKTASDIFGNSCTISVNYAMFFEMCVRLTSRCSMANQVLKLIPVSYDETRIWQ